jgi:uncharacterized protein (UPF0335 family)
MNKTTTIKITNPGSNAVDKKKLLDFVERIEALEAEKATLVVDIAEVYGEVDESEFAKKIVRACVRLRKKSKSEREAEQEIVDLYMAALGDFATTELGQASKPSSLHAV